MEGAFLRAGWLSISIAFFYAFEVAAFPLWLPEDLLFLN